MTIQGQESSPTHYRSASSAYTCVANGVVRFQDMLSEGMRMTESSVALYMYSHCNGQTCSNMHALAVIHAVASRRNRGPIDNISFGAHVWPVTNHSVVFRILGNRQGS